MTLAEVMDAMAHAGCSTEQMAAVTSALDTRSTSAKRQARYRERKRNESVTRDASLRSGDASNALTRARKLYGSKTLSSTMSSPLVLVDPSLRSGKQKNRTSISSDAQPNERNIADAAKRGLVNGPFAEAWDNFRNFHAAKGNVMADWNAAWRTWLGNMNRFRSSVTTREDYLERHSVVAAGKRLLAQQALGLFEGEGDEVCDRFGGLLSPR